MIITKNNDKVCNGENDGEDKITKHAVLHL